jgi:hypothetical protein
MAKELKEGEEIYFFLDFEFEPRNKERLQKLKHYLQKNGRDFCITRRYQTYVKYNVILTKECATYIHLAYGDIIEGNVI